MEDGTARIQKTTEDKGGRKAELLGHYQISFLILVVCFSTSCPLILSTPDAPLCVAGPFKTGSLEFEQPCHQCLFAQALGLRSVAFILKKNQENQLVRTFGENYSFGSPKLLHRSKQGTNRHEHLPRELMRTGRHVFEEIRGDSEEIRAEFEKSSRRVQGEFKESSRRVQGEFRRVRGTSSARKTKNQKGLVNATTLLQRQHSGQKLSLEAILEVHN